MISKIISRAACLRELASNPKSFSNCPDLHGGVPDFPEDRICMKRAFLEKRSSRRQLQCLCPKIRLMRLTRMRPSLLRHARLATARQERLTIEAWGDKIGV